MGYSKFSLLWNLYQLKQNEQKTREQIKDLQNKKLRKLLYYAYDHSPYYHQSFEANGISKNLISSLPLSKFPSINKDILMEHFNQVVTTKDITQELLRNFDEKANKTEKTLKGKYHVVHSSGSTGAPKYFVYNNKAWSQMLLGIIRGALWGMDIIQIIKLLSGGVRILYIAATDGRYGGAMAVGDGIDILGAKQLFLDIKTPLPKWVESVQKFQPNIIIGYPSAIKILGGLMEKQNLETKVLRVISCGEPLPIGLRTYLEHLFGAVVVNFYGSSESLALGVETNPAEGIFLFDDMNIIEIENGQMYLTSLYNYTQPLIRYHMTDQLTLIKEKETYLYPFTQAGLLLCRNEDVLWFENKEGEREFLHPLAVEGLCIEGLLDYQFQQTDKDAFEMLAEISGDKDKIRREILQQIKHILHKKNLGYVRFFVRFVNEIMPDAKTGKKRLIA